MRTRAHRIGSVTHRRANGMLSIEQKTSYMLLTALNNVGSVRAMARQHTNNPRRNRTFAETYGVSMVKPRTTGRRETRVAAATENFMTGVEGRQRNKRGCGRRCHEQKGAGLLHNHKHLANYFESPLDLPGEGRPRRIHRHVAAPRRVLLSFRIVLIPDVPKATSA